MIRQHCRKAFAHAHAVVVVVVLVLVSGMALTISGCDNASENNAGQNSGRSTGNNTDAAQGRASRELSTTPLLAADTSRLEPNVAALIQSAWQDFDEAREKLKGTELAAAYAQLGMVYHAHHLFSAAQQFYERALSLAPGNARWRYYSAFLAEQSGETGTAIEQYQSVIKIKPDYLPAHLRLAELALQRSDQSSASHAFKIVLASDPKNASAISGLARIALENRAYTKAVDLLNQALALQPAANRLYHPLGLALRGLGRTEAARDAFARRGSADPVYADPWLAELASLSGSAQALLSKAMNAAADGRFDIAAQAYAAAVDIEPSNHLAIAGLAQALERLGRNAEALVQVNKVLELVPDYALALMQKGRLLERRGDDQGASVQFRMAVQVDPDYSEARFMLANSLMRLGKRSAAVSEYEAAARQLRDSVLVHYRLGLAQMASGQCKQAHTSLQRASDLNTSYGPVVQALARNLATCSGFNGAQKTQALEDARWLYQQLANAAHGETLAMALAANGQWQDAIAMQEKSIESARANVDKNTLAFMQENLQRYKNKQGAVAPWRSDADVYSPARVSNRAGQ